MQFFVFDEPENSKGVSWDGKFWVEISSARILKYVFAKNDHGPVSFIAVVAVN